MSSSLSRSDKSPGSSGNRDVTIVEVAPRDGLQNDPRSFPTSAKVEFIENLANAGCSVIEATSFVRPDLVPNMADGFEVMAEIERIPDMRYLCLVPNMRGYERARAARVSAVALFLSATEAFSQENTRCSIAESLERLTGVARRAQDDGVWIRGYVSVAFRCPFSGEVDADDVLRLAEALREIGCDEIALADTIGTATPTEVGNLIESAARVVDVNMIALHLHDTHGQALENIGVGFDAGVRIFDAAAGGLGGCPFAPGAPGNVATESVLSYFEDRGVCTGIDSRAVAASLDTLLNQAYPSVQ